MTLEMYVEDRMFEAKQAAFEEGSFQKAYETARNMLWDDLSFETISKYTGLSIEAVQEIADETEAEKQPS